ncbi:hypothetical protein CRG98_049180, partial [Punica granatum]
MKVKSHGSADPARWQDARASRLVELAKHESKLARVSRPSKVGKARASRLGELAKHESKLARVSRPGNVARGTSQQ